MELFHGDLINPNYYQTVHEIVVKSLSSDWIELKQKLFAQRLDESDVLATSQENHFSLASVECEGSLMMTLSILLLLNPLNRMLLKRCNNMSNLSNFPPCPREEIYFNWRKWNAIYEITESYRIFSIVLEQLYVFDDGEYSIVSAAVAKRKLEEISIELWPRCLALKYLLIALFSHEDCDDKASAFMLWRLLEIKNFILFN